MGRLSKSKGSAYERKVADLLRPLWPRAKRSIGQARFGAEKPDVDGTPVWVEAKHANTAHRSAVLDGYEQARVALARYVEAGGSPSDYAFPLVVGRVDTGVRGAPRTDLVILSLDNFLAIVRALQLPSRLLPDWMPGWPTKWPPKGDA
jgi:hypothetical protein